MKVLVMVECHRARQFTCSETTHRPVLLGAELGLQIGVLDDNASLNLDQKSVDQYYY